MPYRVKEIFYTLQGEGANAGRPAVFCRFAGCNLWTGLEDDRLKAVCDFCDTNFVGTDGPEGGAYREPTELANKVASIWPSEACPSGKKFVVCTGGEPLLQLDGELIKAFHAVGLTVAIETNGTLTAPKGIDWICVSPKAGTKLRIHAGDELKLIFPQCHLDPEQYATLDFDHFFVQPMAGVDLEKNTRACVAYCLSHPRWRLSLQIHKLVGIR